MAILRQIPSFLLLLCICQHGKPTFVIQFIESHVCCLQHIKIHLSKINFSTMSNFSNLRFLKSPSFSCCQVTVRPRNLRSGLHPGTSGPCGLLQHDRDRDHLPGPRNAPPPDRVGQSRRDRGSRCPRIAPGASKLLRSCFGLRQSWVGVKTRLHRKRIRRSFAKCV